MIIEDEDYVSFETAKLLKEKGFIIPYYSFRGVYVNGKFKRLNPGSAYGYNFGDEVIEVCSLSMAMKWLREVYNIHIEVKYFFEPHIYKYTITYTPVALDNISSHPQCFNTYEEACEAAIRYCLKNLIKNEDEEEESDIPVPKTVDEAISTLEKILSDEDREYLLKNGAISMHNSLGRWIRNEWGLWTGSELKDELMNMNKGLNHPDDMSNYIIEEFIKYCLS